jgi:hypothetical protein
MLSTTLRTPLRDSEVKFRAFLSSVLYGNEIPVTQRLVLIPRKDILAPFESEPQPTPESVRL